LSSCSVKASLIKVYFNFSNLSPDVVNLQSQSFSDRTPQRQQPNVHFRSQSISCKISALPKPSMFLTLFSIPKFFLKFKKSL